MNYLIGAGGHATVIENIADKNNFALDGVFFDENTINLTRLKRIGDFSSIKDNATNNKFMIAFGDISSKIKLVESLKEKDMKWFTLIDPTATIGSNVFIDDGTIVMPGVIINSGAKIGKHVILNSGVIIEHNCIIEDYVHVSPGSVICGNTIVKRGSWIGAGSVVINALEVGCNVVVGAGSVVIRNIEDNTKVVGNPAKKIKR